MPPLKPIRTPDYDGPDRRASTRGDGDRRASNGHDWTSLRAWANAIGIVGIPGAIAIFLVYIGATEIPRLIRTVDAVAIQIQQNRDLLREQTIQLDVMLRVAQRTCSNAARDENTRQRCFDK